MRCFDVIGSSQGPHVAGPPAKRDGSLGVNLGNLVDWLTG